MKKHICTLVSFMMLFLLTNLPSEGMISSSLDLQGYLDSDMLLLVTNQEGATLDSLAIFSFLHLLSLHCGSSGIE